MFLISISICLCAIYWSQVLSREWRCSWSSTSRQWSKYIWVINSFIAYYCAPYMRDLMVIDVKSKLVQVMAWCHQACSGLVPSGNKPLPGPYSVEAFTQLPYGITRPQWVNQCKIIFFHKFSLELSSVKLVSFLCWVNWNVLITVMKIASQITSKSTVYSTFCSQKQQRKIKSLHYWPFLGESTGDGYNPHTKGQYCTKQSPVMVLPCYCMK